MKSRLLRLIEPKTQLDSRRKVFWDVIDGMTEDFTATMEAVK